MTIREGIKDECPFVSRDGLAALRDSRPVWLPELCDVLPYPALSVGLPIGLAADKRMGDNLGTHRHGDYIPRDTSLFLEVCNGVWGSFAGYGDAIRLSNDKAISHIQDLSGI